MQMQYNPNVVYWDVQVGDDPVNRLDIELALMAVHDNVRTMVSEMAELYPNSVWDNNIDVCTDLLFKGTFYHTLVTLTELWAVFEEGFKLEMAKATLASIVFRTSEHLNDIVLWKDSDIKIYNNVNADKAVEFGCAVHMLSGPTSCKHGHRAFFDREGQYMYFINEKNLYIAKVDLLPEQRIFLFNDTVTFSKAQALAKTAKKALYILILNTDVIISCNTMKHVQYYLDKGTLSAIVS